MGFFSKIKEEREEKRRKHIESLEDKVLLAESVRKFFESDVGKHIKERMEADKLTILKEIQQLDPFDSYEIMKLQCKYQSITNIQNYLGHALIEGENSYQQIVQINNRE